MKVSVAVNLSPGQLKVNGRSHAMLSRAVEVGDSKSLALPVKKYS